MMRIGGLTVLALLVLGCGTSPVMATYTGEDWEDSFMQADFVRLYRVHVPERAELGPAAPLVLVFHGSSQTSLGIQAASGLDQTADAAGFIVAYLEAPMGAWDVFGDLGFLGLDDLGYVREVIERVDRRYVMDRRRIIAVGLSNGGVFSQRLGCELADRLAGFVSVAASMPLLMAQDCTPSRPISALYILGTADPFFPTAGNPVLLSFDGTIDFWARVNGCSGRRIRTALPDLADDGTMVYSSMYRPCDRGTRTVLDSIVGGGHAWPGGVTPAPPSFGPTSRDISANAEIIRFLETIPRD
jgi:polyhydroxybutyrate depolymerase